MTPRNIHGSASELFQRQLREQRESQSQPKRFKSSAAPKGYKLAAGYTDRAAQLRATEDGEGKDENSKEARIKALEDMVKLGQMEMKDFERVRDEIVGGDVRNVHLVKGLDWKLLKRARAGEDVYQTPSQEVEEVQPAEEENAVDLEEQLENLESADVKPIEREPRVKQGAMPTTTSNTPVDVTFAGLPAGGEIQVIAGIYAENDWLCGRWQSETVAALPPPGGGTLTLEDAIEEILVPLTGNTQYHYREKIAYSAQEGHVWRNGGLPTATKANLNTGNIGKNLAKLNGLTINLPAYQIGYSWRASGQDVPLLGEGTTPTTGQAYTFQNLSILAAPESRLKFVNRALPEQPMLAYDTFTNLPEIDGRRTVDGQRSSEAISQRNFYVDARNGQYHLRQLVLSDGDATIDLTAPRRSWGCFPFNPTDGLVVHPSGYVLGLNQVKSMILVLELPAADVSTS